MEQNTSNSTYIQMGLNAFLFLFTLSLKSWESFHLFSRFANVYPHE